MRPAACHRVAACAALSGWHGIALGRGAPCHQHAMHGRLRTWFYHASATTACERCFDQLAAARGHVASPLLCTAVKTAYDIDLLGRRPANLKRIESQLAQQP